MTGHQLHELIVTNRLCWLYDSTSSISVLNWCTWFIIWWCFSFLIIGEKLYWNSTLHLLHVSFFCIYPAYIQWADFISSYITDKWTMIYYNPTAWIYHQENYLFFGHFMWTWSGSQQRQTLSWKYSSGFDDFLKNLLEKGSLNRHKIQFSVDLSPTKYFHGFLKAHQTDATLITSRTQNPLKMHDFQPIYILIKNTFWSSGQSKKHGLISPIILKFHSLQ